MEPKASVLRRLAIEITEVKGQQERDDEQFEFCAANPESEITIPVVEMVALRGFMDTALSVISRGDITLLEIQAAVDAYVAEHNAMVDAQTIIEKAQSHE